MNRGFVTTIFCAFAFAAHACEIFFDDVGHDGEPCSESYECFDGLLCNFDVCGPPRQEGEECDWEPQRKGKAVCDEGLYCYRGFCSPPLSETVEEPGTNNIWRRCPVDMYWDGWRCRGDRIDGHWDSIEGQCPDGYSLPSLDDFRNLHFNCYTNSNSNIAQEQSMCRSCRESEKCWEMFGPIDVNAPRLPWYLSGEFWTTTVENGSIFSFNLNTGEFSADPLSQAGRNRFICLQK